MAYDKAKAAARMRLWRSRNRDHYLAWRKVNYERRKDRINASKRTDEFRGKRNERLRNRRREDKTYRDKANAKQRDYLRRNRDRINISRQIKRSNASPESKVKIRDSQRRYHLENKDKRNQNCRDHYRNNRDKYIDQAHRYYREHREETIAKKSEWARTNKQKVGRISSAKRARKRKAKGNHTYGQWMNRISYYDWFCLYCGKELSENTASQDHAIPLSRGGTNFASNLIPACSSCNSSKNSKTIFEFLEHLARKGSITATGMGLLRQYFMVHKTP